MADGFRCTKCGCQEAEHDGADLAKDFGACGRYRRPRAEYLLECRRKAEEKRRVEVPIGGAVLMLTPYGIVDVGS